MKTWFSLVLLSTFLLGCSGKAVREGTPLNSDLEESSTQELDVKIDSPGWIGIQFDLNLQSYLCDRLSNRIQVGIIDKKDSKKVHLDRYCEDARGYLLVRSTEFLKPGEYQVKYLSRVPPKAKRGQSKLLVEYQDPNYNAGVSQIPSGAIALEKNAVLQGVMNLGRGVQTIWYHLVGEQGNTHVGYLPEGAKSQIKVSVYRMTEELKPAQLLGVLQPKKHQRYTLGAQPLFVKVEGLPFTGEAKFSIFRKDPNPSAAPEPAEPPAQRIRYSILDRYVLNSTKAILVFRSDERVNVGSELVVLGTRAQGKARPQVQEVGKCKVSGIQGGQASCELSGVDLSQVTHLKLEMVLGGS